MIGRGNDPLWAGGQTREIMHGAARNAVPKLLRDAEGTSAIAPE